MSHTHSSERKLQHNDKVWEHNGLSSAQTEARTSLALKGQQASPGFHSVPPVIIVQHYNDYSDGLYFANVGAIRKYQQNMKMQARPERRANLFWSVNFFDVKFPMAWPDLDLIWFIRGFWSEARLMDATACTNTVHVYVEMLFNLLFQLVNKTAFKFFNAAGAWCICHM